MARSRFSAVIVLFAFFVSFTLATDAAARGHEYWFKAPPDASVPWAGLVSDGAGNFYGTARLGGIQACPRGMVTVAPCSKLASAPTLLWMKV